MTPPPLHGTIGGKMTDLNNWQITEAICDSYAVSLPQSMCRVFFILNETRNQNVLLSKNLSKVNKKTPVQGMNIVTRYQQRQHDDVSTMLLWFYCPKHSPHTASTPFIHSPIDKCSHCVKDQSYTQSWKRRNCSTPQGRSYSFLMSNPHNNTHNYWHVAGHPDRTYKSDVLKFGREYSNAV